MNQRDQWLFCDETALLKDCRVDTYKSPGPGGQRKNKVATAVRLVHGPSGVSAQGHQTRSQQRNKTLALRNLRMRIACTFRQPQDLTQLAIPDEIAERFQRSARSASSEHAKLRLSLPSGNRCFWPVAAFVHDVFDAAEGQLSKTSHALGISTANLSAFLRSHRHLLPTAQAIRKAHGHTPLR
ncbi:MAG: peptide chain release factor-like protein [Planctomycetes bacterium]|nr:peptide chain release factor-like protein [Planctomycetota bacterium]